MFPKGRKSQQWKLIFYLQGQNRFSEKLRLLRLRKLKLRKMIARDNRWSLHSGKQFFLFAWKIKADRLARKLRLQLNHGSQMSITYMVYLLLVWQKNGDHLMSILLFCSKEYLLDIQHPIIKNGPGLVSKARSFLFCSFTKSPNLTGVFSIYLVSHCSQSYQRLNIAMV